MNAHINDSSFWRAYEESELTHSAAHYMMTILHLRRQLGYARMTDVAEHLKVSRGAASRAMALLKERGWIEEDPHRMLNLTSDGLELARSVQRNYLIVECFFEDILKIPLQVAREDACKLEHLLSPQVSAALFRMIRILMRDEKLRSMLAERMDESTQGCDHEAPCEVCKDFGKCLGGEGAARLAGSEEALANCLREAKNKNEDTINS